jgi:hypothetical protein
MHTKLVEIVAYVRGMDRNGDGLAWTCHEMRYMIIWHMGIQKDIKRTEVERVNSSMIYLIYCKNFCKCHSVPPPSTTIKIRRTSKKNIVMAWGTAQRQSTCLECYRPWFNQFNHQNLRKKRKKKIAKPNHVLFFYTAILKQLINKRLCFCLSFLIFTVYVCRKLTLLNRIPVM